MTTTSLASFRVVKWWRESTSCSSVEKNDSTAALSKHDPTRPMDCAMSRVVHSAVKSFDVYCRSSYNRCERSPRYHATAGGDGHRDGLTSQVSIGVGAGGIPQQPPEVQVDHGREIQLPLIGGIQSCRPPTSHSAPAR